MKRRSLKLRPTGLAAQGVEEQTAPTVEQLTFISNPRNGFCTDQGVIISVDFSSQELRLSAVLSKDLAMCASYLVPEKLITKDGQEYKNPRADLHCVTAANCIAPERFKNTPEYELVDATKTKLPTDKKSPRDTAKGLNFAMIYLSTAKSISERNHVKADVAEAWVKNHRQTYPGYYEWAEEVGRVAAARGYAVLPYGYNSLRWVAEERAGGKEGDSAERAAVNYQVQGCGAIQTKEAMLKINDLFEQYEHLALPPRLIGQCHDELIAWCPGESSVNWDKCEIKDGIVTKVVFGHDEEAQTWAERIQGIMQDVQTEMFQRMGSEIKGAAEYAIGPVWAH